MQILRTEQSSDTILQEIRGIIGGPTVEIAKEKALCFCCLSKDHQGLEKCPGKCLNSSVEILRLKV